MGPTKMAVGGKDKPSCTQLHLQMWVKQFHHNLAWNIHDPTKHRRRHFHQTAPQGYRRVVPYTHHYCPHNFTKHNTTDGLGTSVHAVALKWYNICYIGATMQATFPLCDR